MRSHKNLITNTGLFFNGEFRKGLGVPIQSRNPASQEILETIDQATPAQVDEAVRYAAEAQSMWSKIDIRQRVICIRKFIEKIEKHSNELAFLDALDSGNPFKGMQIDIKISLAVMDFFAGLAPEIKGETYPGSNDCLNISVREPLGVVARIIPFNHPLMFACIKSVAPLIAGNSVILKPSEHTPLSALRIAELVGDIFPPGTFNILNGDREIGSALAMHPRVNNVSLVGSGSTGKAVLADASKQIKSVLLELGGKNPLIICPEVDLNLAINTAVKGMNLEWTAGQSCGSTSRLLVHDSLYDEVVEGVSAAFSQISLGLPHDKNTQMGCLSTGGQYQKVNEYIKIGTAEGGVLTTGGVPLNSPHEDGYFIRPTVFSEVDPNMQIAREEIFGPVLSIIRWSKESEALRIANSVNFGLTAGILSPDLNLALRMARDVQAGYVWINNSSDHYPGVPFGGVKDSGLGREECLEEMLAYTQVKSINIQIR